MESEISRIAGEYSMPQILKALKSMINGLS